MYHYLKTKTEIHMFFQIVKDEGSIHTVGCFAPDATASRRDIDARAIPGRYRSSKKSAAML